MLQKDAFSFPESVAFPQADTHLAQCLRTHEKNGGSATMKTLEMHRKFTVAKFHGAPYCWEVDR